jgi:hypothetical protein
VLKVSFYLLVHHFGFPRKFKLNLGLQKHIENYQAMGNSNVVEANEDVSNKSEHASINLKQENEQLREYLT